MIRLITTILLALGITGVVWKMPIEGFRWLVLAAVGVGLREFGRLVLKDHWLERGFQLFFGLIVAALLLFHQDLILVLLTLITALFAFFLLVFRQTEPLAEAVHRLGLMMLGILYLSMTLPFWAWIEAMPSGRIWVALALIPACLTDTFAFLVGKVFGRHKFAPVISPNKTWEGFFGALAGSLTGVWIVRHWLLPELAWIHGIAIAVGLWWIAPLGDLAESLIKRSVGAKDAGHMIPGHGGALDRLDALVFAAPFVYGYAKYIIQAW